MSLLTTRDELFHCQKERTRCEGEARRVVFAPVRDPASAADVLVLPVLPRHEHHEAGTSAENPLQGSFVKNILSDFRRRTRGRCWSWRRRKSGRSPSRYPSSPTATKVSASAPGPVSYSTKTWVCVVYLAINMISENARTIT